MIGRILISLILALFAVAAAASGLDRVSLQDASVERLVPAPFRARADRAAATEALVRQEASPALAYARAAVAHDPIDVDSAALLGEARLLKGQDAAAASAFRVAARFGWRNAATQLYWYDAALQVGDFKVAAERADAILRTHAIFPDRDALLEPLEANPAARAILIDHLAARPSWLGKYAAVDADAPEPLLQRRAQVLEQLGASGRPLGCKWVFVTTRTLLARGERGQAVRTWNANCPSSPVAEALVDSGFDHVDADDASPFGWQLLRSGDVEITAVAAAGKGQALRIQNRAPNIQLALQQPVALAAGTYRASATVRGENGAPADRLVASVGCGPAPFPRADGGDLSGPGQVVVVPACEHMMLGIWARPGGEVTLDTLQLRRTG